MALTSPGIGSGLDVKGIVAQLMSVEQRPLTLLAQKEAAFQAQLTGIGTVKSALAALQSAAQALSSASVAYSATPSDSTVLTATTGSGAAPGTYSVTTTALAQQQKLAATGQTDTTSFIGTSPSTITFSFGTISGGTFSSVTGKYTGATFTANANKPSVTINLDGTNNSLAGIRDAINAANAGVTATIVNDGSATPYRLTLTSNDMGVANSLKVAVTGNTTLGNLLNYDPSATQNLSQSQAAQSAQLTVDGVSITSATNFVSGVIPGVTLTLLKTNVGTPVTLTVQRDTSGLSAAFSAFVKAYNDDNKTLADVTGKKAALQGDAGILSVQRKIRTIVGSTQNAGGTYTTLSQLGIAFQKDGSLVVDSVKLGAALTANPAAVAALASALGTAVSGTASDLLATSGPIASETGGINRSLDSLGLRRIQMQRRLDALQQSYLKQFSALDALVGSMNQTSTFLQQQLSALPKIT